MLSCSESDPTAVVEEPFDIIVTNADPVVEVIHPSHLPENIVTDTINYAIVLSLTVEINKPDERDKINKVIIFDSDNMGWEFSFSELESMYSDLNQSYSINNLVFRRSQVNGDKLFVIRLLNSENENAGDYDFILKGDLPEPAETSNYWIGSEELEIRYRIREHLLGDHNLSSDFLYNPISGSSDLKITWLNSNKGILNNEELSKNSFESLYDDYYYYGLSSIPEEAAYFYNSFSKSDSLKETRLITDVQNIANRIPSDWTFFDVVAEEVKIIGWQDPFIISVKREISNYDEHSLLILNMSTKEIVDEFKIYKNRNRSLPSAYFDEQTSSVVYVSENRMLNVYSLNTGVKSPLKDICASSNDCNLYPFGEGKYAIHFDSYLSIYSVENDTIYYENFGNNTNYIGNVISYFYDESTEALFLYDYSDFITKMSFNEETGLFNERETLQLGSINSRFGNENRVLHFSSSDSLLIHTSGMVVDLKSSDTDFISSGIIAPFLSGITSAWVEDEQVLTIADGFQSVSAYKLNGNSFEKLGSLETEGMIFGMFSNDQNAWIATAHPSINSSPNQKLLVRPLLIDDFVTSKNHKVKEETYYLMNRISIY